MTRIGTVAAINRYPVKSMAGENLTTTRLDAHGIVGDRTWALRDAETDKLVSAKRPRLWATLLQCRARVSAGDTVVTMPSGDEYTIDDDALTEALSRHLGRPVTIESVNQPRSWTYESDWPPIDGMTLSGEIDIPAESGPDRGGFVDLEPLHLLTTTAMETLRSAAPELVVDVRRFRPSLLLDTTGLDGFPENAWEGKQLHIGDTVISVSTPTPRCIMTTVAQDDLPRQPEVLQTLARDNRQTTPFGVFACLGAYAAVAGPGTVSVGDAVELS